MNKKIIFIITSLMCVFVNVYAQVSLNPNDDFYKENVNGIEANAHFCH